MFALIQILLRKVELDNEKGNTQLLTNVYNHWEFNA